METKVCSKCREEKGVELFYPRTDAKDGRRARCRLCERASKIIYEKKNAIKIRETRLAYYENNREALLEQKKDYYIKNKEKRKKWCKDNKEKTEITRKIYCKKNKQKIANRAKVYQKENPAKINALNAKYRAKKLKATATWSNQEVIKEFYKTAQRVSSCTGILHAVDHYYPLQGEICCGLHVENNLQVIPATENNSKSNKMPEDFYKEKN